LVDVGRPLESLPRLRVPLQLYTAPAVALRGGFAHLGAEMGGYQCIDVRGLLFPRTVTVDFLQRGEVLLATDGELLKGRGPQGGITILRGLPGFGPSLWVTGAEPGRGAVVEWTARLGDDAEWHELGRRTPAGTSFEVVDGNGGWTAGEARFYRVRGQ
jgi:hypothetical protein